MKYLKNRMRKEFPISAQFSDVVDKVRKFHEQLPDYQATPLVSLSSLADSFGLAGIIVKDESQRMGLKAFKVLGGSYAVYTYIKSKLKMEEELEFHRINRDDIVDKCGDIVFATATDGNHGKGVAYIANKLGFRAEIYVPIATVPARIKAVEEAGGHVKVVNGNYDAAVKQMAEDAAKNNWAIISDTSWEDFRQIPQWVMEGYFTIFDETTKQFKAMGRGNPSHIFIQGGVGTLPASVVVFFRHIYKDTVIIVVEPEEAGCLYYSAEKADGEIHSVEGDLNTMMAGLACGKPNPLAWQILKDGSDFFLICSDEIAAEGMRTYYYPENTDQRITSGESGAVTLGVLKAIMKNPAYQNIKTEIGLDETSNVLLFNTEGDTDPENFQKIIRKQA